MSPVLPNRILLLFPYVCSVFVMIIIWCRYLTLFLIYLLIQECFNSPYGHVHFPNYAENIGYSAGQKYDIEKSESESVKMLSSVAKEAGVWLLGGL